MDPQFLINETKTWMVYEDGYGEYDDYICPDTENALFFKFETDAYKYCEDVNNKQRKKKKAMTQFIIHSFNIIEKYYG